jgi:Zn-dependent peptidase ImmA (M78 family)
MKERLISSSLMLLAGVIMMAIFTYNAEAKFKFRDHISLTEHTDRVVNALRMHDVKIELVPIQTTKGHKNRHSKIINGYVTQADEVIYIHINLELDLEEMHIVLAHELVHVWQIQRGALKTYKSGWVFNERFYPIDVPYNERPHEIEAHILDSNIIFRK